MTRPHSGHQRVLDLGIAPASNSGFGIGRDVRGGRDKGRRRQRQAATRQGPVADRLAFGVARRVAIAAGHDGVDEIVAALDRRLRHRLRGRLRPGRFECRK
jgi:hypothetical protein